MHFSTATFIAVLTASVTSATQMQINYYWDQCSSYATQVDVDWATNYAYGSGNCYNFQYANWANIAGCWADGGCFCNFFTEQNCQNYAGYTATGSGNCIPIGNAQSFACYWGTN